MDHRTPRPSSTALGRVRSNTAVQSRHMKARRRSARIGPCGHAWQQHTHESRVGWPRVVALSTDSRVKGIGWPSEKPCTPASNESCASDHSQQRASTLNRLGVAEARRDTVTEFTTTQSVHVADCHGSHYFPHALGMLLSVVARLVVCCFKQERGLVCAPLGTATMIPKSGVSYKRVCYDRKGVARQQ